MKFYFIKPVQSKKWHIHNGDGRSLCGKWLMTSKYEEVSEDFNKFNKNDCKICKKEYLKLVTQNKGVNNGK